MTRLAIIAALLAVGQIASSAAALPDSCQQLIVGIAPTWDSPTGTIQRFERNRGNWTPTSPTQSVFFGRNGLAWGIGVAGQNESGTKKREGDGRAPAGLFALGKVYTYESSLPGSNNYPFHQVTAADAWIENPSHPDYNRHVRVDPANPPAWFKKEQMKQNDPAHHWKIEILHNSNPPIPGAGSAIFFHIKRASNRPSSGCTTMATDTILSLIEWLNPKANPHYVLLTQADYDRLWQAWLLPRPATTQ